MPNALKIGMVIDDTLDVPDGVQQYVLTVGEWLAQRGHQVHYLASTTNRRDLASLHSLGSNVTVRFNGNWLRTPLPASRYRIKRLLRRERFDVLHVQMPYSPLLAGRVIQAASQRTAVVGTFHIVPRSWWVAGASHLLAQWLRFTLPRYDAIFSVSAPAQAFARDVFGISSRVLPNPIQLEHFRDAEPLPSSSQRLNILFLGRLVPRKGCLVLLQAIALLRKQTGLPPFRVTVCGKGPLADNLERFVHASGLSSVVTFKGYVLEADKPRYYASADITVFPSSDGESFGMVLVEAMASGQSAVLAGNNRGYRTVLGDCPENVFFDAYDPQSLAKLLGAVLYDKSLRRHIAAWQQHHAKNYDIERIGPEIEKVYLSALRGHQSMR